VATHAVNLKTPTAMEPGFATEKQVYLEGRWARALNQKVDDNPYPMGTTEHTKWLFGWMSANYLIWWNAHLTKKNMDMPHDHQPTMYHSFQNFRLRQNREDIQNLIMELEINVENLRNTIRTIKARRENDGKSS
jgi:hypothetical protein